MLGVDGFGETGFEGFGESGFDGFGDSGFDGFGDSGVEEDFLVYTWIVFPFSSFFVSTNLYSGTSFFSTVPFSDGVFGSSFPSLSLKNVLTFS